MESLPEELLIHLSGFLNGWDTVKLSHSCSRFFNLLNNDHIWKQIIRREELVTEKAIETLALTLATESGGRRCLSKWSYILHSKLKRNWRKANFKATSIPLNSRCAVGHDSKNLVLFDPNQDDSAWNVSVYRIDGKGATLTTSRLGWTIDRRSTSHSIASVHVSSDVALVCFSDDETSQEIVAVDLEDLCERWRDDSDLTRLFGNEIFAFHFSTYTVNICDIKTQTNLRTVALPLDVRLPYGQISCDGRNLVVPGKMVADNSPVVCCTNVYSGSHKYLAPSTPVCPYRWFEKTEVLDEKVYGLLNRKTLFIWSAESGACLSRLEISESPPGMAESNLSCNFLTANYGLVATIHLDPSVINVFKSDDDAKTTPTQVNMAHIMGAPVKVCDVFLNPHCLLVRAANCQIPQFHVSIFPLPLKEDVRESYAESSLINLVPVEDCSILHLGVTPSKILNFAEGQLRIYDFIC